MLPELGNFALVLALLLAVAQATLPLLGAWRNNPALMAVARPAAYGQFVFVALAFGILTVAFVQQDFSVAYVAQNSNSLLPLPYRFSAVWGAHEGSLLLWVLILAAWTIAVAAFSRSLPDAVVARVLGVLGIVSVGFLLFTAWTSNPFARLLPAVAEGRDLNPLLQDFGLIVHPPMLYAGYVGFAVAFAFAIAALLGGEMDQRWVRWSRPWTNVAWGFLTLGIALGSWWAYYELGWGGWWFWDPVENASFMPWLVGTALIHSQAVTEKRGSFRGWTLLLAIAAFSLSLLGTFIVRSGVLTSVHAFASDPARGMYILVFLLVTIGGSLALYALRAPKVAGGKPFAPLSRETLILLNNLLFSAACAMVLIGTLSPLLFEALNLGKISVGPPYFSLQFMLLMAPVALLIPFGPFARWQREEPSRFAPLLRIGLAAVVVGVGIAWLLGDGFTWKSLLGIGAGVWILAGTLLFVWRRMTQAPRGRRFTPEMLGMVLAHAGLGVFVLGVLLVESTGIEKDLAMRAGDSTDVRGYHFEFAGVEHHEGPNYTSDRGTVHVYRNDALIATLHPEKRGYASGGQIMTEAAIDPGFTRDLYVALGEPLGGGGAWAVRIYVKPFIRWIWLGALMMMLGGFVAAADRRFRRELAVDREAVDAPALRPAQGTA
ncbi:heme lyase CcmF/NrfE family subunit [Chiayiivirga flava]|uniref:Cytochrome c-type biogenesis protein CcmF n=1 Tax=Chiayiivirga flava TaxID=659595 RepID=A0A7W8G250_9GAMM|nr:heme lyase CcmF/NrfE family subunit [Chiayiivirga flava]MBB5208325.1 cytochrome c-type biogenesis protein CcmF [Chiayiivirga flava]